jgi:hypothetical protein
LLGEKGDEDDDGGYTSERENSLRKEFYSLVLLPIHIHKYRLKEKSVAHEGNREDQQAKHCDRSEDGVRFFSDERGAVGNKEYDENYINSGDECVKIWILSHISIISNLPTPYLFK